MWIYLTKPYCLRLCFKLCYVKLYMTCNQFHSVIQLSVLELCVRVYEYAYLYVLVE